MDATSYMIVITGLAGAVSTLAGMLWNSEKGRRQKAERDRDTLMGIIMGQAAKKDDTMSELAEFIKSRRYES